MIGWAVSNRMKRDLAILALSMAITLRPSATRAASTVHIKFIIIAQTAIKRFVANM